MWGCWPRLRIDQKITAADQQKDRQIDITDDRMEELAIRMLRPVQVGLEDVFLQLTQDRRYAQLSRMV